MKKLIFLSAFLLVFGFTTMNLHAKITVESTQGEAAYKKGNVWTPLTKGMTLEEGTKISTGVKSWAQINIDGNTVRIEQLTMMKISRNKLTAGSHDTQISLKHGSLKSRITKIGTLKTSFKITTPVATSSVRGTYKFDGYWARSGMDVIAMENAVECRRPKGPSNTIKGKSRFHLGPNDARPDNLLLDLKFGALTQLSDQNITEDENNSSEYNSFDVINPGGDPNDYVPSSQSVRSSKINIDIIWE